MSVDLEINGRKLKPIKELIDSVSYSRDHITKLAREGKIVAVQIDRQWYVDPNSLKNYAAVVEDEQAIRKRLLSVERKAQLKIKESVLALRANQETELKHSQRKAVSVAAFAVFAGLLSGVVLNQFGLVSGQSLEQTAAVSFNQPTVEEVIALKQAAQDFEHTVVLEASSTRAVTPHFEHVFNRSFLTSLDEGLLLVSPDAPLTEAGIGDYFSDEVQVLMSEDGQVVVYRVDERGEAVGEEIPFVVVPVQAKNN